MSTSTTKVYNSTGSIHSNDTFLLIDTENDRQRFLYFPTLVSLVILMLFGMLGNACVAVVYKLKFKRSSARVYIISLALADLSVCLVGLPYHIIDLMYPFNYQSVITCKILSFLISSCTLSSVFILLVVGLDRYLKVCRPLKKQIIDFGDRKACVVAVIIATLFSLPYAFIYGNSSALMIVDGFNVTGNECFIDDVYSESDSILGIGYLGFIILLFVLSVLYLFVVYGLIWRKIRRMDEITITIHNAKYACCYKIDSKSIDDPDENADDECGTKQETFEAEIQLVPKDNAVDAVAENEALVTSRSSVELRPTLHKGDRKFNKAKIVRTMSNTLVRHTISGTHGKEKNTRKITLVMLTITIVFIVTYLPFISISVMDAIDADFWVGLSGLEEVFYDLILRIYLLNNIANPIIYSFLDVKFRREVVKIFKWIFRCTVCDKSTQHGSEQSSSNTPQNSQTFIMK